MSARSAEAEAVAHDFAKRHIFDDNEQKKFDELFLKLQTAKSDGSDLREIAFELVQIGYDYCNDRIDPRDYWNDD